MKEDVVAANLANLRQSINELKVCIEKQFKLDTTVGQAVKKGDAVLTIEAMKMEIPVVAPEDGTVASINVAVGDAIESGAVLATLK